MTANYTLEELTNIRRNPTFFQALYRRTDSGRRLFTFPADYYKPGANSWKRFTLGSSRITTGWAQYPSHHLLTGFM